MFQMLERIESWSNRIYGLDPVRLRREQEFRAPLLNRLLLGVGALAIFYLVLGLAGVVSGRFFPYDAIELLLVAVFCAWLVKRGKTSTALVLPLVVYSHFASSVISDYGIASPAPRCSCRVCLCADCSSAVIFSSRGRSSAAC